MKYIPLVVVLLASTSVKADGWGNDNRRDYEDVYRHSYKDQDTLWKDSDRDGIINRYDYSDRDKNVQYEWQAKPKKSRYGIGY